MGGNRRHHGRVHAGLTEVTNAQGNGSPSGSRVAAALEVYADQIAGEVTRRHFEADSSLQAKFGDAGRAKCTEDASRHISYLAAAAAGSSDALFEEYVGWAKILLVRLHFSEEHLARNLSLLRQVIIETIPGEPGTAAGRIVEKGLARLPALPSVRETFIDEGHPHSALAQRYLDTLLAGDRQGASEMILSAVKSGVTIRDIYLHVFQTSQYEIGRRWQMNEMSVAEEHFCTAATQLIMSQLYPQIFSSERRHRRLVAAAVGGDLHEIGVRMVADFFEMAGWDTYYMGANTPSSGLVSAALEKRADAVAISATMSFHIPAVVEVVAALKSAEFARPPAVLVGGYPFSIDVDLWRTVGADGYAADASAAVTMADELIDRQ